MVDKMSAMWCLHCPGFAIGLPLVTNVDMGGPGAALVLGTCPVWSRLTERLASVRSFYHRLDLDSPTGAATCFEEYCPLLRWKLCGKRG
mmetsp:Transcript_60314/g.99667  ORF Transcript_60314/g.99667 Transcript_60314/m.99667 type:complete len:89 (-) Transcript_60314:464-730(-)